MNRPTARSVLVLTVLSGALAALVAFWKSAPIDQVWISSAMAGFHHAVVVMQLVIMDGYRKSPELVLVLGAVLLLPVLALLGAIQRIFSRIGRRREAAAKSATLAANASLLTSPMSRAWLALDGRTIASANHEIRGEILRIGRDGDNDLSLHDDSVQQFHAVIRRTPDAEFLIIDVGGQEDLVINGRQLLHARLRNGDRIALGRMEVTFHRAMQMPLGHAASGSSAVH